MSKERTLSNSASHRVIKHGEVYDHPQHGHVEVTGIWQGTEWVESVRNTAKEETIVVRILPPDGEDWSDELSVSLSDFLDEIG